MHGGNSRRGIAHPNYQTGRYAKDLPPKLAEQYEASLQSQALTSLRGDLSLCDIRIGELLRRLTEKREPLNSPLWKAILEALAQRRKLVEVYDKHAIVERTYIPLEQASQVIKAISMMIKAEVRSLIDPKTGSLLLTRLSQEISKYLPPHEVEEKENSIGRETKY
ncbi:MAG: hypothetical protein NPIRA06_03460 [Nitrospirales bacterium]|nr:MAG: hypothetical protein NPIRA06_03460 [Nitrospirales bacterium]